MNDTSILSVGIVLILVTAALAGCTGTGEPNGTMNTLQPAPLTSSGPAPDVTVPEGACLPVTITQTNGDEITLPCRPERIIVTNSDAAEMLIALGAEDRIVGIVESTKSTPYIIDKIPRAESIGDWQTPNIERMLALKPDIVISYASSKPKNLDQILAANITIVYLDCYRLPKLAQDARAVGRLTGREDEAEAYVRMVENITSEVMNGVAALPHDDLPTVYFEGYSDFTAAGTGSGSDELLVMAGGKNIAGGLSGSSPKVSAEWVVGQRPAYVMKVISSKESRPYAEIARTLEKRTGWGQLPAVQDGRVYLFSSGIEYGPKAYIGLAATAKVLHPDLFADLDPGAMLDNYAAAYVGGANATPVMYP